MGELERKKVSAETIDNGRLLAEANRLIGDALADCTSRPHHAKRTITIKIVVAPVIDKDTQEVTHDIGGSVEYKQPGYSAPNRETAIIEGEPMLNFLDDNPKQESLPFRKPDDTAAN